MKQTSAWWRSAVIHQIYPRSFRDGNGDGMGDLLGITAGLEAIKDLGVDAIWLSPFYPSPQKDGGYDVADFTDVDPRFGSLEDFFVDNTDTLVTVTSEAERAALLKPANPDSK